VTDVLENRGTRVRRERPVPVALAALTTACWAAVVGAAPVVAIALVAWIADSRSGAPAFDAIRIALDGWLLAHGAWLDTPAGPFGLAPLALSILAFRQLARAGANSARATGAASTATGAQVVALIGVVYAGLGTLAAWVGSTGGVHTGVTSAGVCTGGFGAAAAAYGVLKVNGIGRQLLSRIPLPARRALPAGVIAAGSILGAGALLAGVRIALAAEDTALLFAAFSPGFVGSASLLALSLVYAPTAAIWGAAYLVGPGFAVGTGTTVSPMDVSVGPVPAFPLFAGLPGGSPPGWATLLVAVPLAAGILAGIAVARRRVHAEPWTVTLLAAALAGPVGGVLLAIAAVAAGGPLGQGRMASMGPSAWQVGLAATAEITVAALVGAGLTRAVAEARGAETRGDPAPPAHSGTGMPPLS
jgi:hypothetical protein